MTAATRASPISLKGPNTASTSERASARAAVATVDLDAVAANWRAYARLPGGAEAAAVVKADAYGLGADYVAPVLARAGARTFFTATLAEALGVRRALGPGPEIFVLEGFFGPTQPFEDAALSPVLNAGDQVTAWRAAGNPRRAALHIDTGMHRLGLEPREAAAALAALAPALVMSHLACASTPEHPQNAKQLQLFRALTAGCGARLSLAASAGALIDADYRFDMIRPGVGLYGDSGLEEPARGLDLAPCVRLDAPILQTRDVEPGAPIGYGATFLAPRPMRLATIGLGYADGVLRSLSGKGYGVIDGVRCAIRGRVSMDLVTIDVTDVGDAAHVGAMVELLGPNAPLADVAARAGTAPYELLTNLRAAARRYIGDQA